MSIDERRRLELHDAARSNWGSDVATTLMEMLPPSGWGDVATRQQLASLEARIDARFTDVNERFARVDERIDAGFARVDERFARVDERFAGVNDRFDGVNGRFATMERQLRSDLRGDINEAILRMHRWTMATILASSAVVVTAVALFNR